MLNEAYHEAERLHTAEPAARSERQSKVGIASLALALAAGISLFCLVVGAAVLSTQSPRPNPAASMAIGFLIFATIFVELVALGLGIAGLIQPQHKKLAAILGVVLSAVTLFVIVLLIIIGSLAR